MPELKLYQAKPPFIPHLSEGDFPAEMLNNCQPEIRIREHESVFQAYYLLKG